MRACGPCTLHAQTTLQDPTQSQEWFSQMSASVCVTGQPVSDEDACECGCYVYKEHDMVPSDVVWWVGIPKHACGPV